MRRFNAIIFSYDFGITIFVVFATYLVLPQYININFALSFYNVAITVLSIIFSLFFTAMAIIMSSSDNDFIDFLEEKNTFTELLWSFKFTLLILFFSLILSIVLYTGTSYWIETNKTQTWLQDSKLLLSLQFFFLYGIMATLFSVLDTVKFSKYRSDFLKNKKAPANARAQK